MSGETIVPDSEHRGLIARLPQLPRDLAMLARFDRPIGWWLLFWPCAWGVWLTGAGAQWALVGWLLVGAIAMRGLGFRYGSRAVIHDLDLRIEPGEQGPVLRRAPGEDGYGASVAVAVTGIAGPGGGSADKPVGTVWLALVHAGRPARVWRENFSGDRHAVRGRLGGHVHHVGLALCVEMRQIIHRAIIAGWGGVGRQRAPTVLL